MLALHWGLAAELTYCYRPLTAAYTELVQPIEEPDEWPELMAGMQAGDEASCARVEKILGQQSELNKIFFGNHFPKLASVSRVAMDKRTGWENELNRLDYDTPEYFQEFSDQYYSNTVIEKGIEFRGMTDVFGVRDRLAYAEIDQHWLSIHQAVLESNNGLD